MQSGKAAGPGGDQAKQIEDLKQKLAAAEAKAKDYGALPVPLITPRVR